MTRRSVAATIQMSREAALSSMCPALQEEFLEIDASLSGQAETAVRFYHALGSRVIKIQNNPEEYGENALALLQSALGTRAELLRRSAAFAAIYSSNDIDRALGLRSRKDEAFRLTWTHMIHLTSVESAKDRRKFESMAVDNAWDPTTLHEAIKAHYGGPRRAGGRKHSIPNSAFAQVRQFNDITDVWLAKQRNVWHGDQHSMFRNICSLPVEECHPNIAEQLSQARRKIEEMRAALDEDLELLDQAAAHVMQGMSQAPEPATIIDTTATAAEDSDLPAAAMPATATAAIRRLGARGRQRIRN